MRYIASVVVVGGVFFVIFGSRWVFIAAVGSLGIRLGPGLSLTVVLGLVIHGGVSCFGGSGSGVRGLQ